MTCPSGYIVVTEGRAKICVPDPNLYRRPNGVYEPSWAPVFYNPVMIENRNVAIAFLRVCNRRNSVVLDPLAGTGVRSVRIALEVPEVELVIANDIDAEACRLISINAELNGVSNKIRVQNLDANELMFKLWREHVRVDYVDIDPFGSPAPFVQAALTVAKNKGFVAFTATDLAPLEGKYPHKLLRRYGIVGTKLDISKHIALRNLIAFIARIGGVIDKSIRPLLSYYSKHYARLYVEVDRGGKSFSAVLSECLGYVAYCARCGYRELIPGLLVEERVLRCRVCCSRMLFVGPTWICETSIHSVVQNVAMELQKLGYVHDKKLVETLVCEAKFSRSLPIRVSTIARHLKMNMPKLETLINRLQEMGYEACRTYVYHDGLMTNAPYEAVIEAFKECASSV